MQKTSDCMQLKCLIVLTVNFIGRITFNSRLVYDPLELETSSGSRSDFPRVDHKGRQTFRFRLEITINLEVLCPSPLDCILSVVYVTSYKLCIGISIWLRVPVFSIDGHKSVNR